MNDLPDTNSIYAMIQLNEGLLSATSRNCAAFEMHLMAIKMKLWPIFQGKMNKEVESVGLLSQKKEPNVKLVCQKYVWFFSTMMGLESTREDTSLAAAGSESKLLNELIKLRDTLVSFIQQHAQKLSGLTDASRQDFLRSVYQDVQTGLMVCLSSFYLSRKKKDKDMSVQMADAYQFASSTVECVISFGGGVGLSLQSCTQSGRSCVLERAGLARKMILRICNVDHQNSTLVQINIYKKKDKKMECLES